MARLSSVLEAKSFHFLQTDLKRRKDEKKRPANVGPRAQKSVRKKIQKKAGGFREKSVPAPGRGIFPDYFFIHFPDSSCTQTPALLFAAICLARARPTDPASAPVCLAMIA